MPDGVWRIVSGGNGRQRKNVCRMFDDKNRVRVSCPLHNFLYASSSPPPSDDGSAPGTGGSLSTTLARMVNRRRSRSWASGAGLTLTPTTRSSGPSLGGLPRLFGCSCPAVSFMHLAAAVAHAAVLSLRVRRRGRRRGRWERAPAAWRRGSSPPWARGPVGRPRRSGLPGCR